jgi:hypothetical protein
MCGTDVCCFSRLTAVDIQLDYCHSNRLTTHSNGDSGTSEARSAAVYLQVTLADNAAVPSIASIQVSDRSEALHESRHSVH